MEKEAVKSDIEIAGELRTVLVRLIKLLRRESRNEAQLSLTERAALGLLYQHGELLPSDIARAEKVTTQSMSQVINHLVELNYIRKNTAADDRRKVLLSLTPEGRADVEQRRLDKQEWLARALEEKVSVEEKALLLEAIKVLEKLMKE